PTIAPWTFGAPGPPVDRAFAAPRTRRHRADAGAPSPAAVRPLVCRLLPRGRMPPLIALALPLPAPQPTPPPPVRQSATRTALAGIIGNVLEWFDFAAYGFFVGAIGEAFFPKSSPTAQELYGFAGFAVGFVGRPIGSLVLGIVGD